MLIRSLFYYSPTYCAPRVKSRGLKPQLVTSSLSIIWLCSNIFCAREWYNISSKKTLGKRNKMLDSRSNFGFCCWTWTFMLSIAEKMSLCFGPKQNSHFSVAVNKDWYCYNTVIISCSVFIFLITFHCHVLPWLSTILLW